MPDFATSDSPAVQAQLDRLGALSLPQGRFGLEAITALLARLGDPHLSIPPAFHVAGTNGKGSTCAFLRAMLEAEGYAVHAAASPHLVRYNERIRIAGKLVEDEVLAGLLGEVLDAARGLDISFFEATIAASFLAFARVPADVCVIEVGLGGRFDATNVLPSPAACGIATLGIDHEAFLLAAEEGVPQEPLPRIAFEKASIAKQGAPLVTQNYPREAAMAVAQTARMHRAELFMRGQAWRASVSAEGIEYVDCYGPMMLPLPMLAGAHQADNAALALAMLRHQDVVKVSPEAMAEGILKSRWPGRMQLLGSGPLTALVPGRKVWLDGGHNPDAGTALAKFFGVSSAAQQVSLPSRMREGLGVGQTLPLHLIIGMLANKNSSAIVEPLSGLLESITAVPVPGHECHPPAAFGEGALSASSVTEALQALPPQGDVLIAGSLYLAGEVLRLNRELPD